MNRESEVKTQKFTGDIFQWYVSDIPSKTVASRHLRGARTKIRLRDLRL